MSMSTPTHLVADAAADGAQELGAEGEPVGRHAVGAGDGAQAHHVGVGALVALHAHGADGQEHGKGLPGRGEQGGGGQHTAGA